MGCSSSKSAARQRNALNLLMRDAKPKPATATPNKAASTIRDATVAFGAGHGALLMPMERRIAQYLRCNYYMPQNRSGRAVTPVPLLGTTSQALHDEVMAIRAPFHLVVRSGPEVNIS